MRKTIRRRPEEPAPSQISICQVWIQGERPFHRSMGLLLPTLLVLRSEIEVAVHVGHGKSRLSGGKGWINGYSAFQQFDGGQVVRSIIVNAQRLSSQIVKVWLRIDFEILGEMCLLRGAQLDPDLTDDGADHLPL